MSWRCVAKLADLRPAQVTEVFVDDEPVALYLINGTVYATAGLCTHAPSRLAEGFVDGETIECDRHMGCFHIPTGKATKFPCVVDLQTYPVRVDDGMIAIDFPAARSDNQDAGNRSQVNDQAAQPGQAIGSGRAASGEAQNPTSASSDTSDMRDFSSRGELP